jgi:hypothetical protein
MTPHAKPHLPPPFPPGSPGSIRIASSPRTAPHRADHATARPRERLLDQVPHAPRSSRHRRPSPPRHPRPWLRHRHPRADRPRWSAPATPAPTRSRWSSPKALPRQVARPAAKAIAVTRAVYAIIKRPPPLSLRRCTRPARTLAIDAVRSLRGHSVWISAAVADPRARRAFSATVSHERSCRSSTVSLKRVRSHVNTVAREGERLIGLNTDALARCARPHDGGGGRRACRRARAGGGARSRAALGRAASVTVAARRRERRAS